MPTFIIYSTKNWRFEGVFNTALPAVSYLLDRKWCILQFYSLLTTGQLHKRRAPPTETKTSTGEPSGKTDCFAIHTSAVQKY